jgi:hypothetical protein
MKTATRKDKSRMPNQDAFNPAAATPDLAGALALAVAGTPGSHR